MHYGVAWQHERIVKALRGHDNYYGYADNVDALKRLRYEVTRIWQRCLARRSRRPLTWERFGRLLKRFPLPSPVVHRRAWRLAANPSA